MLFPTGLVRVDLHIGFSGCICWGAGGASMGLVLKAFDDDGAGNSGGYVANLKASGSTVQLIVGCHKGPAGGDSNWNFYRDGVEHSDFVKTNVDSFSPIIDDQTHSLGWYRLSAEVSVINDTQLQIVVTVHDPAGLEVGGATYVDTGTRAYIGPGQIGLTNAGLWGIGARYDNFSYEVEAGDIPGDTNGDGAVDVSDLGILSGNYGTVGTADWEDGDFTGEGDVDVSDLGILSGNYGWVASAPLGASQPLAAPPASEPLVITVR